MRTTSNILISLLLCLILPLQAGVAMARSVRMAQHTMSMNQEDPVLLAHASPLPHQHHVHAHHEHHNATKAHPEKQGSSHKSQHAKSECSNCAKCCLIGAYAPPPAMPSALTPAIDRQFDRADTSLLTHFIPEGLERPPRSLSA